MELVKSALNPGEFSSRVGTRDRAAGGLTEKLGIPPHIARKWNLMVERAAMKLVPASRILELEHDIEELKTQVRHQAITIKILERKGRR